MQESIGLNWDALAFGLDGVFWSLLGLSLAAGIPLTLVVGWRDGPRAAAVVLLGSVLATFGFIAITGALPGYDPDLPERLINASGVETISQGFIVAAGLTLVIPVLLLAWVWRSSAARQSYKQFLGGFFASTLAVAFIVLALGPATDIAADLVGKVEAGIPEDDMRNPMVSASVLLWRVWVASAIQVMLLLGLITSAVLFSLHHRSRQNTKTPPLRRSWWLIPAWGVVAVWFFFLDQQDFLRPAATAFQTASGTGLVKGLSSVFILVGLCVFLIGLIWFNRSLFHWRWLTVLVGGLLSLGVALIIGDVAGHHTLEMATFVSESLETHPHFETLLSLFDDRNLNLPLISALYQVVLVGLCACVALDRVGREGSTQDLVKSVLIGLGVVLLIQATSFDISGIMAGTGVNETRRQFREMPGIMNRSQEAMPVRVIQLMLARLLEQAWPLLILVVLGTAFLWRPRSLGVDSRGVAAGMLTTAGILFAVGLFWWLVGDGATKIIEDGNYGGKGSDAHRGAVDARVFSDAFFASVAMTLLVTLLAVASWLFTNRFVIASDAPVAAPAPGPVPEVKAKERHPPMTMEEKREWFGFAKFFLGTFVLGLITAIVSSAIQNREMRLAEVEHDNLQLKTFMGIAELPLDQRKAFGIYFSSVARDDEVKQAWGEFLVAIDAEIEHRDRRRAEDKRQALQHAQSLYDSASEQATKNPALQGLLLDYLRTQGEGGVDEQLMKQLLEGVGVKPSQEKASE